MESSFEIAVRKVHRHFWNWSGLDATGSAIVRLLYIARGHVDNRNSIMELQRAYRDTCNTWRVRKGAVRNFRIDEH